MFTEVVVAIYETDEDAEAAVASLAAAHVPATSIHRHAQGNSPALDRAGEHTHGFWHRLFGGHSSDHAIYDRALHNGGNVVTVNNLGGHDMGHVMSILEQHNPIDVDEQAVSFSGIAHDPDPAVSGAGEPGTTLPQTNESLVNQGGPRVRRFAVTPQ